VALAGAALLTAPGASAETVVIKYRGPVDLTRMSCVTITRSSPINRLCYDCKEKYVVVQLDATYYHDCGVPADVISNWRAAQSIGRYYNAESKAASTAAEGTCRRNESSSRRGELEMRVQPVMQMNSRGMSAITPHRSRQQIFCSATAVLQ
jgi:hypothetical protein